MTPRRIAAVAAVAALALTAVGLSYESLGQAAVRSILTLAVPDAARHAHVRSGAPRPGHLTRVHFYSRALHRVADYLVYLPRAAATGRRLPVFYGLHGMPGHPLAFTANAAIEPRLEWLVRRHRVRPMILVFPDGRIGGHTRSDSEWANTAAGRFDSYVVDVVRDVDHRFRTLPRRADRVIAGLSAGAYGAANVGLHHLGLFGGIQVWSGYFRQTHDGVFAGAGPATMVANSPLDYAWKLRSTFVRDPTHVFIYTGTWDADRWQTPPMTAELRAVGADATDAVYRGGHSWTLWSAHTDQMLELASRWFAHPAVRR
ncbi:MAG TPA: alpha/beta hydrolase-fold protein [Solirubrobacteraceae bacterium]|nr:alpha/beta hydrolase-fold protein [Solirubrobacteraceae bacterium]